MPVWLVPPLASGAPTRSVPCSMRFTGRPRPIPDDDSTRCMTRSTAGTSCGGRGARCAATTARRASTSTTLADVEEYGVARLLGELEAELKAGAYRPLPARRVFIPKPGSDERRPLSIPSVRDRIVQAAVKIVLEPIFEADFLPCSFGFRPETVGARRLQVLVDESSGCQLGGGDGRGRLFRLDSALRVDVRGRGTRQRSAPARTAARVSARGGDGARRGPAAGHRHPAGRGGIPVARQRLPAPAGPGMAWRLRDAGPVRRRRAGDVPVPGAGGGRAGAADRAARRARSRAEGGQDPDREAGRWAAREWTSSASTTGWCSPGPSADRIASPTWPDGPHARRCSMPETASGS